MIQRKIKNDQRGMTLAELMMVMPIVSLILLVLFTALFTQYTAVLAESSKARLRTSGQTLLINLQDELLFTIGFGETTNDSLTDVYEPDGGWTYDSDPATLIINEIALDSTRHDVDRHVVRERLNACESSTVNSNPVALNNIVYFIEDVPNSAYDKLVKRVITPTYDLCGIDSSTGEPCSAGTVATCLGNAKETTCPELYVGVGSCASADSILSENVKDMQISYFAKNNVETEFPSSAEKIEVKLILGQKVYGKDVEVEVNHTIRKIN